MDNNLFDFGNNTFSVSFWVRAKPVGLPWGTIVGNSAFKGIMVSRYSDS